MFKHILALSLCFLIASAMTSAPETGEVGAFLNGLNNELKVESEADFEKCADVPLIADINKTFHDLNTSSPNPLTLAEDALSLYSDYTEVKAQCPPVAAVYEAYFAKFTAAINSDPAGTLLKAFQNALGNWTAIQAAAIQGLEDLGTKNFYGAGQDFGKILKLTLEGWIK